MFQSVSSTFRMPTDMNNPNNPNRGPLPQQGAGPVPIWLSSGQSMDRNNPNQPNQFNQANPVGGAGANGGVDPVNGAQQKQMIQVSPGGSNCLGCVGMKNGLIPVEKLEELKSKMFNEIMAHEQAHASAAGAFGGAIHIDYDANGIAVGGHVPINIPGLSKMNPEESLKAFETIYNAALAPGDPSSQDMSVASQAQDLMGRAKVMMDAKMQREGKMAMAGGQGGNNPMNPNNPAAGPAGMAQNPGDPNNPLSPMNPMSPLALQAGMQPYGMMSPFSNPANPNAQIYSANFQPTGMADRNPFNNTGNVSAPTSPNRVQPVIQPYGMAMNPNVNPYNNRLRPNMRV